MKDFSTVKIISIELGEKCNLSNQHQKCPSSARLKKDKTEIITMDQILSVIDDVAEHHFSGEIAFHYYNEPLLYLDQIQSIIEARPQMDYLLWTNGELLKDDIEENAYLNLFHSIVISNYGGESRYRFYCELQKRYPNITRIINYQSLDDLDDRKEIYTNEVRNKYGCCRPINIELPIDCYGDVHLCCRDWDNTYRIGNIKETPLSEIIQSEAFLNFEASVNQPLLDLERCPDVCKSCTNPDRVSTFIEQDYRLLESRESSISFVVVTRAIHLGRLLSLLHSLVPLKDELCVILDSTDQYAYEEISKVADRVEVMVGKGCFEAYELDIFNICTKDWIFRMDDDETLSPECTRELLQQYVSDRTKAAYWIPRKWYISPEEHIVTSPWMPDYQLRLYRNLPAIIELPNCIHASKNIMGKNAAINQFCIQHWDLIWNSREKREEKVRYYERLLPGNGCDCYYLYETENIGTFREETADGQTYGDVLKIHLPQAMKKELTYTAEIELKIPERVKPLLSKKDVFFSYHWFNQDGTIYHWDYPRFEPPVAVEDRIRLFMPIQLPETAGEYRLQMDIVEELVQWFSQSGLLESHPKTFLIQ
ncbi:MAG: hypothetical protein HFG24_10475 [Anaerotruncus sp.]|jgi:hypothetical protein|nr:hypothetical protein [Anaerotruncus sp.]